MAEISLGDKEGRQGRADDRAASDVVLARGGKPEGLRELRQRKTRLQDPRGVTASVPKEPVSPCSGG